MVVHFIMQRTAVIKWKMVIRFHLGLISIYCVFTLLATPKVYKLLCDQEKARGPGCFHRRHNVNFLKAQQNRCINHSVKHLALYPSQPRLYCVHEYTVKNLQFALTVEPSKVEIQQKLSWAQNQRQAGRPTIPSSIEEEMETNPFMRVNLPEIQKSVGCNDPVEGLQEIR